MWARKANLVWVVWAVLCVLAMSAAPAAGHWEVGPGELVWAGGAPIVVPGYSVPSLSDLNGDGLEDLIVGAGGGGFTPSARVYYNTGSPGAPQFGAWEYLQADGADMTHQVACPSCVLHACMGLFPRAADWDADGLKDLVVGQADGTVLIYRNVGTTSAPTFDAGQDLTWGEPGSKALVDVAGRAAPAVTDWNSDGKEDLIVGNIVGRAYVWLNEGTDTAPDFRGVFMAEADGGVLAVPTDRASPDVFDFDADGRKDLLTGNTEGQLLVYLNVGTDAAPTFSGYDPVLSDGAPIDLYGEMRSRPSLCDWNADGIPDVLVGYGDGLVRLYPGVPEPACATLMLLGACGLIRLRRRTRSRYATRLGGR